MRLLYHVAVCALPPVVMYSIYHWIPMLALTFFFFFNDPPPTEIYPLSLPDALPISRRAGLRAPGPRRVRGAPAHRSQPRGAQGRTAARDAPHRCAQRQAGKNPHHFCRRFGRSEEHTSELQSQSNLVCRLLLEKKKEE